MQVIELSVCRAGHDERMLVRVPARDSADALLKIEAALGPVSVIAQSRVRS